MKLLACLREELRQITPPPYYHVTQLTYKRMQVCRACNLVGIDIDRGFEGICSGSIHLIGMRGMGIADCVWDEVECREVGVGLGWVRWDRVVGGW